MIPFELEEKDNSFRYNIQEIISKSKSADVILIPSPNNPSGSFLKRKDLELILNSVKSLVIIDAAFLKFDKETPRYAQLLKVYKNLILVYSFSKFFGLPGLRVGYIIADENLISKLKSEKITIDIFTSTLCQKVCSEALKQDYLKELRNYFRNKRDIALYSLEEHFRNEDNFIWNIPKGGIFILGEFSEKIVGKEVIKIAKNKYNLILEEDKFTYSDGRSRNTTRINFVQNSDENLREGILKLYKSFIEVKNGS